MFLDYFLTVIASILILLGLIGCIVPILPGPPLSWIGMMVGYATKFGNFDTKFIILTGILTILVTIADYILPIWTTKKMGGSKRGVWGATIGLIVGILLLPPIGIILGPFIGAYIGEVTDKNNKSNPWLSATGSFIGFLLGTGLKFAVTGVITYHFAIEMFFQ